MSKKNGLFNVEKAVILRTAVLLLALVNTVLQLFGLEVLPFTSEEIESALSVVLIAVASLSTWYKNNSFTEAGRKADEVLREEKAKRKGDDK